MKYYIYTANFRFRNVSLSTGRSAIHTNKSNNRLTTHNDNCLTLYNVNQPVICNNWSTIYSEKHLTKYNDDELPSVIIISFIYLQVFRWLLPRNGYLLVRSSADGDDLLQYLQQEGLQEPLHILTLWKLQERVKVRKR